MPRLKKAATNVALPDVNEELVTEDMKAAEALGRHLAVVDEDYGDALVPYHRERVVTEARFFMQAAAHSLIELGRRLILLKEHEQHGDFLVALDAIGVEPRFAQRAMQATVKLGRGEIRKQVEHLGRSKLLELLVLDDEQLDGLAAGGTVAQLTLDEIDRMPVSELRARLRDERKSASEAQSLHDQQLVEKNKKIDELDRALARRDKLPPEDRVQEVVSDIWETVARFDVSHQELRRAFTLAAEAHHAEDQIQPEGIYTAQCQALVWLMQRLEDLRREFNLFDVSPAARVIAPFEREDGA